MYVLNAEYDLRAWQTLLTTYIFIDVDFDSPSTEFEAEAPEEEQQIKMHSYARGKTEVRARGKEEFGVFGRAFLALELGRPHIELISLYREAAKALFSERSIDAYNLFFLFLESQFCRGRTGTEQATSELMKSGDFMSALSSVVERWNRKKKLRFTTLDEFTQDPRPLVREIVMLRGHLRHHSLNSPRRWDPDRQEHYDLEARFLSLVAFEVAFPKTTGNLWQPPFLEQFVQLAKEMKMTITIQVKYTIREGDHIHDIAVDMSFPQPKPDPQLARAVLERSLKLLEEKNPAAEIFAVRATVKSNGAELFRYDLGATLSR